MTAKLSRRSALKLSAMNVGAAQLGALRWASAVLLLGKAHIARGATIVAVRAWPSKDYTRLTIESDGEI